MDDSSRVPYTPNPYTPNLSGLTVGKPVLLSGLGVFVSYTISLLHEFGLPLTAGQQEAIETWVNQAEIFLLPVITYFVMKAHFQQTAVDLLHQDPPATTRDTATVRAPHGPQPCGSGEVAGPTIPADAPPLPTSGEDHP